MAKALQKAKRYVAFDVETTGLNAWRGDRIKLRAHVLEADMIAQCY